MEDIRPALAPTPSLGLQRHAKLEKVDFVWGQA